VKLSEIILLFNKHGLEPQVKALAADSVFPGAPLTDNRLVNKDDIFVCIKGASVDGHSFIPDVLKRGAALVVVTDLQAGDVPQIKVNDTRKAAALLAKLYFKDPASSFRLVGVTGTNGKTSSSLIIFEALRSLGYKAGWIGTLGYRINDKHYNTQHTTPDIMELNSILAQMRAAEVTYVIMEVSSHAIALDRVYGIQFDYCLFTNLSRDHLDFHSSMEEYGKVKASFFDVVKRGEAVAIINTDDAFGAKLADDLSEGMGSVFTVGTQWAAYEVQDLECDRDGLRFILCTRDGGIRMRSGLVGSFNAYNLALAAATFHVMNFDLRDISAIMGSVKNIPGRMQSVPNDRGIGVYVDYAHTPQAIEAVLKTCHELPHKRVLCLMGAGGDRDQGKRPLMLSTALKYSDAVIVTDDNPRGENPNAIIRDIISGSHPNLPWWIIRNREQAIRSIIHMANEDDIVVICGKGHENYQEIEGVRHPFDDVQIAAAALADEECKEQRLALPIDQLTLRLMIDETQELPARGYSLPHLYWHISTDTRNIQPESVFFALKGERFDAHAFLGKALESEANFAIGELALPEHDRYLQTESSLNIMAKLHAKYLAMFDIQKVALTGSTGKTTCKEILANVCNQEGATLKTHANENNIIGLCQTIRRVQFWHRYGIFELGTSEKGEIAALAEVLNPDVGIVLNIGPAHLQAFGDEDGVYTEKSALLRHPLQVRLYDGDDPRFVEFAESGKGIGYTADCAYRIHNVHSKDTGQSFGINDLDFYIPSPVPHNVTNAAFAIAFALERGFATDSIQKALIMPLNIDQRLEIQQSGTLTLIVDCYNANPVSMHKAIEYWQDYQPQRPHIAILGDMLELGEMSEGYHQMIGAILTEMQFQTLITVGANSLHYQSSDAGKEALHFADVEAARAALAGIEIAPDAVILIKASNGIHLEKLLPIIKKEV